MNNKDFFNNEKNELKEIVVHCKKNKYDVYIGRGSKWGNPFIIGVDGTREVVIQKYKKWIKKKPELLKDLPELKGKILGCYCAPKACHGDILIELIKEYQRL